MSRVECVSDDPIKQYNLAGLRIYDAPAVRQWDAAVLSDPALFLKHDQMNARLRWDGKNLGSSPWGPDTSAFLPAHSDIRAEIDRTYHGTLIKLDADVFSDASADIHINHDDLQFSALPDEAISQIGSALLKLGEAGVLDKYPLLAESLGLNLTVAALRNIEPQACEKIQKLKSALSRERKRRVLDFVEDSIHRPFSLYELAGTANLSQFHFARSFKKAMGTTPAQYVLHRRIERAKLLLRGRDPISTVSMDCGFSSQSHFATAFKFATGVTPTEYRRITKTAT